MKIIRLTTYRYTSPNIAITIENSTTFKETRNKIHIKMICYTDGLKSFAGVGCAFWVKLNNNSSVYRMYKLPDNASIYTAEAIAILKALEWFYDSNNEEMVIATDSLSVLNTLKKDPTEIDSTLVFKIITTLTKIKLRKQNIAFIWARWHSGK